MADAAIGATIQVVLETVLSLANDRIGQVLGFKEELDRLSETATTIRGFVADADDRKHSPVVLDWLKKLEGVVFKAENVLDEINYESLRRQVKYRSQLKQNVCFFFSFFSTIGFRSKMASKIRDINMNLKRINEDANHVGLVTRFQTEATLSTVIAPAVDTTRRQTDSVVVLDVVGRKNDESKIMEMLLSPSDKVISVIPILGPAGLGKTTLAKSIYNNSKITKHFGKMIWVCVAEKIKIEELFKFILESLTGKRVDVDRRSTIVDNIRQELGGKRYFLVLDDVWDDGQGLWRDFFNTFEGLSTTKGSWCLVTTRLEPVADAVSRHLKMNVGPQRLGKLSDDECWSILKGKVVSGEVVPNELEAIKKQILKRCGGLPLSAILIGGLLLNNRKEEWQSIVEESLMNGERDDVKQIIKASFDHLSPTSVKKCFAYCSLFPQDTELDKDLLIEIWMAEGCLQSDPNKKIIMEDIGDKYFRILLQSSLLEKGGERWRTNYKMHDLVHDFAKSTLNEDRHFAWSSSQGIPEDVTKKSSTLRTLFLKSSISGDVEFECLHVLKLSGLYFVELPTSIGKLIHLRFLDISNSTITKLPESLCKLYNLQTLRISNDTFRKGLPKQMSNLISLRHLHCYDGHAEFEMPSRMGRLIRLQTLEFFNVGPEDGRGIEELGNLKDLKGSLEIRNLELVNGKEGADEAKLFEKCNLSKLTFIWSRGVRESDNCDEEVMEGLQPHPNLQELEIRSFMGDQFPGWFINLSTLVRLEFRDCEKCTELPALGQLPSLESLRLIRLKNMRSIGFSFYYGVSRGSGQVRKCFPCLKYLLLDNMENLEEWKDEDEVKSITGAVEVNLFPVLVRLDIQGCSRLISAPRHFPSIEVIHIRDNCHVSLLKIITTLSSLILNGYRKTYSDNDESMHVESMYLQKRRHINNSEGDVEYHLDVNGCGGVPGEMLERLCHLPGIRHLKLTNFSDQQLIIVECDGWTSLLGKMLKSCISLQKLIISDCKGFTSLPAEMLQSCSSLQDLVIFRCKGLTSLPGEMLQSCSSLQDLVISGCKGLTSLPSEMLQSCSSLQNLKISLCDGLTSLPGEMLQSCSSLQNLNISSCNGLTSLLDEMLQSCSSLQDLVISGCKGLTSLPGKMLQSCSSLQNLNISCCNGLSSLPGEMLQSCSSLQDLVISGCKRLTSLPGKILQSCSSLQNLNISCCNGLTSLPNGMLESCASLGKLEVDGCHNLVYFPHNLRQTPSLEILNLSNCPKLMIADMPKGFAFLTSLRELEIGPFSINETNEEFDWSALTTSSSSSTLTSLGFFGLPHVESLPEQLQYFTSLTELRLRDFGIEALPDWIGNLGSLKWLILRRCGKLRCLPSVAVRRRLTKFTSLTIDECSLLKERYMGDTNSEWPIQFFEDL